MKTVVLVPIADVEFPSFTPGAPFPNDGLGHFSKIDEGMPVHDGDESRIDFTTGFAGELYELTPLPADFKTSMAFRIRASAASDNAIGNLAFSLLVNDVSYAEGQAGWDFTALAPDVYHEIYLTMTGMPTLVAGDRLQLSVAGFAAGDIVALTAVQVEVDYDNRPPIIYSPVTPITTPWTPVPEPQEFQ